jgi:hypothetical protein
MKRALVVSLVGSGELEGCGPERRVSGPGTRALKDKLSSMEAGPVREAFPSPRQKRASGLKRSYYPDYLRELVDYDYDESLPDDARVWLAAFTEEFYRGWRLRRETQLHGLTHLRAAGAENQRRRAHQDPMAFGKHRGESVPERGSGDEEAAMITRLDRWRR